MEESVIVGQKTYDQQCDRCGVVFEVLARPGEQPPCKSCGGPTQRIYLGGYGFIGDEFPGGKVIENLGPEPVTVHSKSELKREMELRGLVPAVRHVGLPGSDKNPNTSRWV